MGKLYGKDISPKCIYCEHGNPAGDGDLVLCLKKGVMQKDDYCKRFKYDPLKRVPLRAMPMTGFSEDDFKL